MTIKLAGLGAVPHPTQWVILSETDLPDSALSSHYDLLGVPAIAEMDGVPMPIRTSPYVPAGHVYVLDEAALGGADQ